MAIRFSSATMQLQRTTSLPSSTVFTACLFCVERGTPGSYPAYVALGASGFSDFVAIQADDLSGELMITDPSGQTVLAPRPAIGTPYFIAITNAGTGASDFKGYFALWQDTSLTNVSRTGRSFTPAELDVSIANASNFANGDFAYIKVWDAVLTQAELELERQVARPVRTANLHLFTPLWSPSDVTDYSGNGRDWSVIGSPATADMPPVSWGAPILGIPLVVGAGQQYNEALTLARYHGFTDASNLIAVAGLTLSRDLGISDGNNINAQDALALAKTLASLYVTTGNLQASISLAKSLGAVFAGGISFETAITLARSIGIALEALLTKEEAIALAKSLGYTPGSQLTAQVAFTLAKQLAIAYVAQATLGANLTFAKYLATTYVSELEGGAFEESVAFVKSLGLTPALQIDLQASINFLKQLTVTNVSQGDLQATLDLAKSLGIPIAGNLNLVVAITLAKALTASLAGEIPSPITAFVALTLYARLTEFTLEDRSLELDLDARSTELTLEDKE